MKPIDYRNETWDAIQERIAGMRLAALNAWRAHGPGTTREVARRSGIDILTFRPRTTELYQLGFLMVSEIPKSSGPHEGVYQALADDEVRAAFYRNQSPSRQPELNLTR